MQTTLNMAGVREGNQCIKIMTIRIEDSLSRDVNMVVDREINTATTTIMRGEIGVPLIEEGIIRETGAATEMPMRIADISEMKMEEIGTGVPISDAMLALHSVNLKMKVAILKELEHLTVCPHLLKSIRSQRVNKTLIIISRVSQYLRT